MPKKEIDYSKTIIYKICCKDPTITDIYVGHTTDFIRRKSNHKTICHNVNNKDHNMNVYKFIRENGGWINWDMIEIEKVNCIDKLEACKRERYYIEKLKASLNKLIPSREQSEYAKLYYDENKDVILQKHKDYKLKNKDVILQKDADYRLKNKEIIKQNAKEYRENNKEKEKARGKLFRENNKEKEKLRGKIYRENNKEILKEKNKDISKIRYAENIEYYKNRYDLNKEKLSEKVFCNCGAHYTFQHKSRHERSIKHQEYIESTKLV